VQDILLLSPLPLPKSAIQYAAMLAGLWKGQLTGLHVCAPLLARPDPSRPSASTLQLQWEHDRIRAARAAGDEFERYAMSASRGRCRWRTTQGSIAESVASMANWHDLLVLQRQADATDPMRAIAKLIMCSRLPVMVLPPAVNLSFVLDRVMVACDGGHAGTRALHAALDCLRIARDVELMYTQGFSPEATAVGFDPSEYLRSQSIEHRISTADPNADLHMLARKDCADLLVISASGSGRFGEWKLDGAVIEVLQRSEVPVLLMT